jgi:hypothetical protein
LFTSPDPRDRDFVRADASALQIGGDGGDRRILDAGLAARGLGWQLGVHVADQPIGSLRDTYWRSGRGVIATTFHYEEPPGFSFGGPAGVLAIGYIAFDITSRAGTSSGYDVDASVRAVRWSAPHGTFDVFAIHDIEYDGETHYEPAGTDTSTRPVANDIACDIAALDWQVGHGLELSLHGGFEVVHPTGIYTQVGTMVGMPVTGPQATVPRYWAELAEHGDGYTVHAGAGSWARLDPTGQAADAGELATAGVDWKLARAEVKSELELGALRRAVLGDMAPAGIAPVGTTMVMGRGVFEVDMPIARGFALASSAWVERSDRDDPRWVVPAGAGLATHAGVDVSALWKFGKR